MGHPIVHGGQISPFFSLSLRFSDVSLRHDPCNDESAGEICNEANRKKGNQMSRLLIASMSLLFISAVGASASASILPGKVEATFNKVYVPGGFDSNDNVQIVGEGMFKNTCYRHAETTVRVEEASHTIYLGPVAYEYAGLCLQVILPFERVVDVGILTPGTWKIVQGDGTQKLGEVSIRTALTDSPDEYLYAPISQAFFQQKGAVSQIFLTGDFPNECMSMDDVKVTLEKDVIVIQPIAKMETRSSCKDGKFPFAKSVSVDLIPAGRYLLHVRSMNGHAVNSLVDVK